MNQITIDSDETEIIASGTATTFSGKPMKISFKLGRKQLALIISFKKTEKKEKVKVKSTVTPEGLELILYNFGLSGGASGSIRPIQFYDTKYWNLSLHLRVYSFGKSKDKTFFYTIYKSKKKSK